MTKWERSILLIGLSIIVLAGLAILGNAQAPTLQTQGYSGGCDSVTVFWFTKTPQSQISHFNLNTFAGGFTVANDKRSFKIPCACGSGGQVIITEVRTSGTVDTAQYSGNLPHNRPCDQCAAVGGGLSVANGASWGPFQTEDSIAVLGTDTDMISGTAQAGAVLPFNLLGLTVEVAGQPAGLFYVSPRQINFWIPRGVPSGLQAVTVTTPDGRLFRGTANLQPESPAIFTETGNGQGYAKATWGNGYVSLWGTGFKSPWTTLYLGDGRRIDATYSGEAPGYYGLTQHNFPISRPALALGAFVRSWVNPCRCIEGGGFRDSNGFDLR
jgi:uncharacterized protein (TIGR03437 family)